MSLVTPSQTVGPYFDVWLRSRASRGAGQLPVSDQTPGQRILIEGQVLDGAGAPMPDALVETWQADAEGRYRHPEDARGGTSDPSFTGYGWAHTRADGGFTFETIKPGRVPHPGGGEQAPHVLVSVMARGILTRFVTRIYFEDEPSNAEDAVLALVPEARRQTLIAKPSGEGRYRFDLIMQGPGETVFFDV